MEEIGLENTSQYEPHKDETQNKQTYPKLEEELKPTAEVGDHYIRAEILLPRRDKMARGNVMVQSHDSALYKLHLLETGIKS